ncbi:MAG: hypothetical protein ABI901_06050, partial [Roseiflexaceae bacterium]
MRLRETHELAAVPALLRAAMRCQRTSKVRSRDHLGDVRVVGCAAAHGDPEVGRISQLDGRGRAAQHRRRRAVQHGRIGSIREAVVCDRDHPITLRARDDCVGLRREQRSRTQRDARRRTGTHLVDRPASHDDRHRRIDRRSRACAHRSACADRLQLGGLIRDQPATAAR